MYAKAFISTSSSLDHIKIRGLVCNCFLTSCNSFHLKRPLRCCLSFCFTLLAGVLTKTPHTAPTTDVAA